MFQSTNIKNDEADIKNCHGSSRTPFSIENNATADTTDVNDQNEIKYNHREASDHYLNKIQPTNIKNDEADINSHVVHGRHFLQFTMQRN